MNAPYSTSDYAAGKPDFHDGHGSLREDPAGSLRLSRVATLAVMAILSPVRTALADSLSVSGVSSILLTTSRNSLYLSGASSREPPPVASSLPLNRLVGVPRIFLAYISA